MFDSTALPCSLIAVLILTLLFAAACGAAEARLCAVLTGSVGGSGPGERRSNLGA